MSSIRPDAATATWLAWVPDLARHASIPEWKTWLRYGLPTSDTELALTERISSEKVNAVAEATTWQPAKAAAALTAWAKAECSPTIDHMRVLAQNGRKHVVATHKQIDKLWNRAVQDTTIDLRKLDRTEVGVLLALLGHPDPVLTAVRHGIFSAHDLQTNEHENIQGGTL